MKIDSSTTAFITGGAKGIGLATAESLLQLGARVWLVDISGPTLKSVESSLRQRYGADRVYTSVCNVIDDQELSREFNAAVQKFKHIKVILNNAGFGEKIQFASKQALKNDVMPKEWVDVLDVCLKAVINGTRLAVSHLLDIKNSSSANQTELGTIINIASMGGLHPMRNSPIYCAAKHGVVGFSRSLKYLSSSGIFINAICPSFVDTALVRDGLKSSEEFHEILSGVLGKETLLLPQQISQTILMVIQNNKFKGAVVSVSRELGIAQHFVVPNTPNQVNKVLVPAEKLEEGQSLKAKL